LNYSYRDLRFEFSDSCLEQLASRRQTSCVRREIGGQLFARVEGGTYRIEHATVTRGRSRRARFGFWPDRAAEKADILRLFEQDLHYVGDWHTHPEPTPHPSAIDSAEMLDIFRRSKHELAAMLLVIVGQSAFPKGLFVGAVHGLGVQSLHPDAPVAHP